MIEGEWLWTSQEDGTKYYWSARELISQVDLWKDFERSRFIYLTRRTVPDACN